MKRSIEALVIFEMAAVIVAMAIVGLCGIARAEPVQQFSFQVESLQPEHVAVRVHLRRFDTTGAVPPTPTELSIRLPRGVGLNRAFLTPRYLCDGPALRDALDAHPSGTPFTRRLAHLDVFARELARSRAKRDRAELANVRACERGRIGDGTGLVDARDVAAVLKDLIPFRISVFLSRGTIPGAIAAFTAVGAADERSAIVRRYPVVAGVHAIEVENLVSDPTPDGRYGLKFEIYTGPINGLQVSRAEVDVTIHTLVLRRGTCLAASAGGRCTRRQRSDATLFRVPSCPASGSFGAQLLAAYPPPTPSATTTVDVPCPPFGS